MSLRPIHSPLCLSGTQTPVTPSRKEKKENQRLRLWRQFNEKPSIIWGCPGVTPSTLAQRPMTTPRHLHTQAYSTLVFSLLTNSCVALQLQPLSTTPLVQPSTHLLSAPTPGYTSFDNPSPFRPTAFSPTSRALVKPVSAKEIAAEC